MKIKLIGTKSKSSIWKSHTIIARAKRKRLRAYDSMCNFDRVLWHTILHCKLLLLQLSSIQFLVELDVKYDLQHFNLTIVWKHPNVILELLQKLYGNILISNE